MAGRLSTVATLALAAAMVVVRAPEAVRIAAQTPTTERAAAAAAHDAALQAPADQERHGHLRQRQAAVRAHGHPDRGRPDRAHHALARARRACPSGRAAAGPSRRGDRRHRQVRHAGHGQHAHALARGADAGHSDAHPVRAQPLSRQRIDDGARSRRRRRQDAPLAQAIRRPHDCRAPHRQLPDARRTSSARSARSIDRPPASAPSCARRRPEASTG